MAIQTQRLTYEDLQDYPDDGRRYELIGGDLIVSPAPFTAHQTASFRYTLWAGNFVTERRLGHIFTAPYDVKFTDDTVVQPDIVFVSHARRHIIGPKGISGAPDLVVEIISPGSRQIDEGRKRRLYARHGVREYWLIDYERRTVRVLLLNAAGRYDEMSNVDGFARSVVLPGFAVEVAALFAEGE